MTKLGNVSTCRKVKSRLTFRPSTLLKFCAGSPCPQCKSAREPCAYLIAMFLIEEDWMRECRALGDSPAGSHKSDRFLKYLQRPRPTFDATTTKTRSIKPSIHPKRQNITPTSAKQTMLNNACANCPATPQNNSPSLKDTNPVIAPKINVLLMSNMMKICCVWAIASESPLESRGLAIRFCLHVFLIIPFRNLPAKVFETSAEVRKDWRMRHSKQ
jgi:hypothetical protein